MEMLVKKEIKSKKELYEIINNIIEKEKNNRSLIKNITTKFINKGLSGTIPALLFDTQAGNVSVKDLDSIELMCLTKALQEEEKCQDIKKYTFFSGGEEAEYELFTPNIKTKNMMVFRNVSNFSTAQGLCFVAEYPLKEMYNDQKNRNLRYNFETQRESKKKNKNGLIVKEITLNKKSVDDIAKSFEEGTYFPPDAITLNIIRMRGKRPSIEYNESERTLTIIPNYDFNDTNFTAIDVVDGWHRISGAYKMFREGKENNNSIQSLPVVISSMTADQAREFIVRKSKGNQMSADYINSIETGGIVDFVKRLNAIPNQILFNNIADTFEDMQIENKVTDLETIKNVLKILQDDNKIDFDDVSEVFDVSEEIADIVNTLYKRLIKEDEEHINIYNSKNIWIGYIGIAEQLRKYDEYERISKIKEVVQRIKNMTYDEIFKLKLNVNKNYSPKSIYNCYTEKLR
ncbi:MAG: hypothetical protein ACRCVJ_18815 [Clostridium sp.]|uniref:hypothetical protein n=1 Tax=Clostridium sp. TaxID=1506 RepID=UPI003F3452BF